MKAIILAAGYGTRLKPLTDNKPKALIEVNGKTLLEICILKLKNEGIKDIIVNVHHFSEQIIKYLKEKNNFNINIQISEEEKLLDTGGGIKKARWFLDDKDPFLVYNVDIISDIDIQKFYNFHIKNNPLVSLAVSDRKSTNYLLFDSNNFLAGWKSYKTDKQIISR
ncbi:MAG: sugar phosphate nucleotidyltransferase, partial [Bacteroidota bacterium]|nr:sugar phosphate nucleotidyltransferase [Bacteroidota bacterium]